MNHLVYKTTNQVNDKVYIGIHSTDNINDGYIGSGTHFKEAIKQYGKDSFSYQILHNFKSRKEALLKEAELVDLKFVRRKDNYNISTGGGGAPILLSQTERRAIKVGFNKWDDFTKLFLEFSHYHTAYKIENKIGVNGFEVATLKNYIKNGGVFYKDNLIKYQKYQDEIFKVIQYVIYGEDE